ncbi:MAG: ABC transporter ATP-binding protein [Pseudomonadota bacterium]|nr:ABC transporter ATP-binding protein [Pseudomonadota bacterium]
MTSKATSEAKSQTPPRLEVKNLYRSFGDRNVVDGVSLAIEPGKVTCLLGPSGCGKSTTLRLIAGVDMQDTGEIYVDGNLICDTVFRIPPERRQIGLMFQDFALFPHMNVAGNVAFGLAGSAAEKRARVEELLAKVGLSWAIDAAPHALSGGEQQRVALARALAPRPRIMLMDEPFSGLDNRLRDGIRDETLALLKEEDTAVLLVTHEPEEALRMADEIALMRNGKIVQAGAPYNIYNAPVDRDAMAFFSDINLIKGTSNGALCSTAFGDFLTPGMAEGTDVEIAIRPQHVHLDFYRNGAAVSPSGAYGMSAVASVERARFMGTESLVELRVEADGTALKATVPNVFLPEQGTKFMVSLKRNHCFVFKGK